jgi:hypothetical protein
LPINCAIVSIGTASSAPAYKVSTGRSKSAPAKPAAPEINAAVKLDNIKTAYVPINNVPVSNLQDFFCPFYILTQTISLDFTYIFNQEARKYL